MEIQIITEQDFYTCESGLMPARLQSCQPTAFKEDGKYRYITSKDVCTQSCIDFSCSKLMLLAAAVAALVAAFAALCIVTGGAAAVVVGCIAAGAIAGAGGAVLGGIVGSLICGQLAAPARRWLLFKNDFTIHNITTINSDHIMICTIFSLVGLPPQQIKHAPNITSWGQAITKGITGFIGKVFEGMLAGACIGACVGGIKVLATSGSWAGAGRMALQFVKSIPGNIKANYLLSIGKIGGAWSTKGIVIASSIRGGMGALGAAQSYGETGEFLSTDTLAAAGKGIIGVEIGLVSSIINIFTPGRSWQDIGGLGMMMIPFANAIKPRPRVKQLAYEKGKTLIDKTKALADRVMKSKTSATKRGPCLSGVFDKVTGKTFFGKNFNLRTTKGRAAFEKFKENAHPITKKRIEALEKGIADGTIKHKPSDGTPGAHSEVVALDKALKAREKATGKKVTEENLGDFELHNRSTSNNRPNKTMHRCGNCGCLTDGVDVVGGHN